MNVSFTNITRVREKPVAALNNGARDSSHPGDEINVLLVDDRHENLLALEAVLSDLGARLVYAHSGQEALQYLLEDDAALILLDVQMPEMDGFETARLIHERERTRHIPIIFLTAIYTDDGHRGRGYLAGAVDYIFKPFDTAVLRTKVGSFIELSRKRTVLEAEIRRREQAEAKLRHLNSELERRVRSRTARLSSANEKLKHAARAKDEFLAVLAHELRSPLAPLLSIAELLHSFPEDANRTKELSHVLEREVTHLARLVDDLLDATRISTGKIRLQKQQVTLAAVISRALEHCQPLIELHRHQLDVEITEDVWLYADPVRLTQVFVNLLSNAAKYTKDGGSIKLGVVSMSDRVLITVEDTGIGIPKAMLKDIFQLFKQVDTSLTRAHGGLGIGLALAKRIIAMHDGQIQAHSEGSGQGSKFTVQLPRLVKPRVSERMASPEDKRADFVIPDKRFLVVDDSPTTADALAAILRQWGQQAAAVYDGAKALEYALAHQLDVIILDVGLPGMSGYEVAEQLRRHSKTQQLLLIAVTGYGQESDVQRASEAGFDLYFVKPLGIKQFKAALIDRWRTEDSTDN